MVLWATLAVVFIRYYLFDVRHCSDVRSYVADRKVVILIVPFRKKNFKAKAAPGKGTAFDI